MYVSSDATSGGKKGLPLFLFIVLFEPARTNIEISW